MLFSNVSGASSVSSSLSSTEGSVPLSGWTMIDSEGSSGKSNSASGARSYRLSAGRREHEGCGSLPCLGGTLLRRLSDIHGGLETKTQLGGKRNPSISVNYLVNPDVCVKFCVRSLDSHLSHGESDLPQSAQRLEWMISLSLHRIRAIGVFRLVPEYKLLPHSPLGPYFTGNWASSLVCNNSMASKTPQPPPVVDESARAGVHADACLSQPPEYWCASFNFPHGPHARSLSHVSV